MSIRELLCIILKKAVLDQNTCLVLLTAYIEEIQLYKPNVRIKPITRSSISRAEAKSSICAYSTIETDRNNVDLLSDGGETPTIFFVAFLSLYRDAQKELLLFGADNEPFILAVGTAFPFTVRTP